MLTYDYINKEWIVSPTARRVYRSAAGLSLAFLLFLVAIQLPLGILGAVRPILKLLVLIGVVSSAIIAVGMEYFLLRFDESHPLKQVFWFVAMLFVPLGPALNCLIVYSRSGVLKSVSPVAGQELVT